MAKVTLGSTGIIVEKNGFGALPIQRLNTEAAVHLLRKAYESGFQFFDTAHVYSDSEEKIGIALHDVRDKIYIASKSMETTADAFRRDLEDSLKRLQTDYIDILQFHNPSFCPYPGDKSGIYDAAVKAKEEGLIRHIGITNHRLKIAKEAIESGLYETLQFPFCYLATEEEKELVEMCKSHNMGFIAMKALSGGLITNGKAAYAFEALFDNVLPIWGIQKETELDEFIQYMSNPPEMDEEIEAIIKKDINELSGSFCRSCGYCMPCPVGIQIHNCARMSLLLRRARKEDWLTDTWKNNMKQIEACLHCNQCASRCPYGLNTPELLQENYKDYMEVLAGKEI